MEEITEQNYLEKTIKAGDLMGINVITDKGKTLGKVGELLISPNDLCLKGIIVRRGLIATDLFIGHRHIKNLSKDSINLLATPFAENADIKVFDTHGKHIGSVKSIKRNDIQNGILSIVINQLSDKVN